MRRFTAAVAATAFAFAGIAAGPSSDQSRESAPSEPTHTFEMAPGDSETVVGQLPAGFTLGLAAVRDNTGGAYPECSTDLPGAWYCESVLVSVTGGEFTVFEDPEEGIYEESINARLTFELAADLDTGDFDIRLFESDADGTVGERIGASQELVVDSTTERVSVKVKTTEDEPTRWYLAVIDYWAAVGNYSMDITVE